MGPPTIELPTNSDHEVIAEGHEVTDSTPGIQGADRSSGPAPQRSPATRVGLDLLLLEGIFLPRSPEDNWCMGLDPMMEEAHGLGCYFQQTTRPNAGEMDPIPRQQERTDEASAQGQHEAAPPMAVTGGAAPPMAATGEATSTGHFPTEPAPTTAGEESTPQQATQEFADGLSSEAQQFIDSITSLAPAVVLNLLACVTPKSHGDRAPRATSLRRSKQIASTGRAGNAIDQAQTVLMRKLGLISP